MIDSGWRTAMNPQCARSTGDKNRIDNGKRTFEANAAPFPSMTEHASRANAAAMIVK